MEIKRKIYILSGAVAIVFLIAIFWAVPFLIRQISRASSDLLGLGNDLAKIQEEQKNFGRFEKEYRAIKPEAEKISDVFIEKGKAIDFIIALEKIAQQSGNQVQIQVMETKQELTENIDFQVSLWGEFSNLVKFIAYLDNLSYLNQVDVIQIERVNQDDSKRGIREGEISSVLQIRAFFEPTKNNQID
ncbi:MAG: hypothetical protein UT31_C0002G0010 [Parcubacteria group bacterium GW2011_GWF2_39_13b]|nr:MAG: hypothetical protein UT31_C0002G0010 [Parcubacteria group bacterium GW2011_GWF2_39_13b]